MEWSKKVIHTGGGPVKDFDGGIDGEKLDDSF